jgi:stage II sporulation protein D
VNRYALGAILTISSVACLSTSVVPALPAASFAVPRVVRVQFVEGGKTIVRDVPIEEYVQATALSEVAPPAGDVAEVEQMLEVQAIISRTYAISHVGRHARDGYDVCSTTHCQLFEPRRLQTSRWAAAASEAIAETAGAIVAFERRPAQALYHADCGGYTSTPSAVWGGVDWPYLLARPDRGVSSEAHVEWRYDVPLARLGVALNLGPRVLDVDIIGRDAAGRAEQIAVKSRGASGTGPITTTAFRGDDFRQLLGRAFGQRSIRSTRFDVARRGDAVTFSGRGFGHGVGLCQAGAFARIKAGATPMDVLRYYYPGTAVVRARAD